MAASLLSKDEYTLLIFAGQIIAKLMNNFALISSLVVGSTSSVSFSIQLQMFSLGFTSGDCGGNSILRLSLFSYHASIAL